MKSERESNWKLSNEAIDITNDFNFGFEIRTCLTPFHKIYPAYVINFKFEDLNVYIYIFISIAQPIEKGTLIRLTHL